MSCYDINKYLEKCFLNLMVLGFFYNFKYREFCKVFLVCYLLIYWKLKLKRYKYIEYNE